MFRNNISYYSPIKYPTWDLLHVYYNIFVTLFIIIIKSEVSTPLIVLIFSKVVSLRWLYHHSIILIIYIHIFICPGKSSFLSIVIVQSMMHANINIIHQSLKALFACLHITLCHYMNYMNSPHKGQWCGALMFSLICALNQQLSKQSWGWWFEMLSLSLWRHCNDHHYANLNKSFQHFKCLSGIYCWVFVWGWVNSLSIIFSAI